MPKENGRLQKAVPDEPFAVRAREVGGPDGDDPAVLERSQRVQRAGQLRRRCRHPAKLPLAFRAAPILACSVGEGSDRVGEAFNRQPKSVVVRPCFLECIRFRDAQ